MSILAIQRQHAELFRIRLGKRNGTTPTRLINEIRITSPNGKVIKAFAKVYGGRPKKWPDAPGGLQYEVFLPTSRLPVTFIGGQTLTQHMELWAGSTCKRRCDSVTMSDGTPCACGADKEIADRECKPTSRLRVACPEVAIAGVGLLTTHSAIAAAELDGVLSLIGPALEAGRSVNAILRVDQMSGVNRQYAVPRIELEGVSFQELALAAATPPALGSASAAPLALEGGE